MSNDNMTLWVTALRSGAYKQIGGSLCGDTDDGDIGYCCLGVAEALRLQVPELHGGLPAPELGDWLGVDVDPSVLDSETEWDPRVAIPHTITEDEFRSVLGAPPAPLSDQHGRLLYTAQNSTRGVTATELNDSYKLSFEEIANLIEKYGIHEEVEETSE